MDTLITIVRELAGECPTLYNLFFDIQEEVGVDAWKEMRHAPLTFEDAQFLGNWLYAMGTAMVFRSSSDEGAAMRQESLHAALETYCAQVTQAGIVITYEDLIRLPRQVERESMRRIASMFPPLPDTQ